MPERLRRLARDAVGKQRRARGRGAAAISRECRRLLEDLRKRCPGLIPPDPLPPGTVGAEIPLDPKSAVLLLRSAVAPERGDAVLWVDGDNELLVETGRIELRLAEGSATISIPVRCDQVGATRIDVAFAIGDAKRPAGLIAATESRPRGPAEVVEIWGEALTATAWQALLRMTDAIAAASGQDEDGAGLIPAALAASPEGFRILTMARHDFDRRTGARTR